MELFENCLPPIILHHQLYSIVHSRTVVDKDLVSSCSLFVVICAVFSDNNLLYNTQFLCLFICPCVGGVGKAHSPTDSA